MVKSKNHITETWNNYVIMKINYIIPVNFTCIDNDKKSYGTAPTCRMHNVKLSPA